MGGVTDPKWITEKVKETPSGTINGSNTVFTLSQSPANQGELQLYLDGLIETDYSLNIALKQITFTTPPVVGQSIHAVYRPS